MKKLFVFLLIGIFCIPVLYGADEWDKSDPAGTESPADLDDLITTNNGVLDRVLSNYRQGVRLTYASAATITMGAGAVTCSNSDGSVRHWRINTSSVTVTWSDLDTGSEANSTTYYVYAIGDADSAEFTGKISTSSTAPSGVTYYRKLGSFYNDSSGNITRIDNDDYFSELGTWTSRTNGVTYQATTDGMVTAKRTGSGTCKIYTDSSSSPTTDRVIDACQTGAEAAGGSCPVKKGDYYKTTGCQAVYWISLD